MASSAEIGVQSSNYTGNAELGGGSYGVINIDTKPLAQLAAYTMLWNKAKYDQRQKDAEAEAKELAEGTSYGMSTAIQKDAETIKKKFDGLTDWYSKNAKSTDYREDPAKYLERRKLRSEFENDLRDAKARNLQYLGIKNKIEAETDVSRKALMQKTLDEQIATTDIHTPLKDHQFDLSFPEPAAPKMTAFDVIMVGANTDFKRSFKLIDWHDLNAKANLLQFDVTSAMVDENSAEFLSKSKEQQDLIRQQNAYKNAAAENGWLKASVIVKDAINSPEFKNADGTLNIEKLKNSNAVGGIIAAAELFNEKAKQEAENIKNGMYQDKMGKKYGFDNKHFFEPDYKPINWQDGIDASELAKIISISKAPAEERATSEVQTDNQVQNRKIGVDEGQLKLEKDKWKASQTGSETVKNGAYIFAQGLYSDLEKLADKNGVISPDDLRKLNAEQLKYLGIEVPGEVDPETGKATVKGGYKPLDISPVRDEKGKVISNYAIQLENGEIKVMKDAQPRSNGTTGYEGFLVPEKSTSIRNIATNRLNEELTKAGAKELNSYMGVDVSHTATTNTSGGSSSQSGAVKNEYKFKGKAYTKKQLNDMGYTDDQILQAYQSGTLK